MIDDAWKAKAEFNANLIERWLKFECPSWALESVMEMRG